MIDKSLYFMMKLKFIFSSDNIACACEIIQRPVNESDALMSIIFVFSLTNSLLILLMPLVISNIEVIIAFILSLKGEYKLKRFDSTVKMVMLPRIINRELKLFDMLVFKIFGNVCF